MVCMRTGVYQYVMPVPDICECTPVRNLLIGSAGGIEVSVKTPQKKWFVITADINRYRWTKIQRNVQDFPGI